MTTKEAFEKLISEKKWFEKLGITESAAYTIASRFRSGKDVSTDKIEDLLKKAGLKVVQEKLWK